MECRDVEHLLPALHWKALDPAQSTEVLRHLKGCEACRKEDSLFSATWQMLGNLPETEPSPTFRTRFWQRVRREEKAPAGWRDFFGVRWMPVAAGLLAMWIVGVAGGVALYEARGHKETLPSAKAVDIFTSPYPMNSIEAAYVGGGQEKEGGAHS